MFRDDQYEAARKVVAELIARESGEAPTVRHYNEATKVLWPLLSQETQGSLVLR